MSVPHQETEKLETLFVCKVNNVDNLDLNPALLVHLNRSKDYLNIHDQKKWQPKIIENYADCGKFE